MRARCQIIFEQEEEEEEEEETMTTSVVEATVVLPEDISEVGVFGTIKCPNFDPPTVLFEQDEQKPIRLKSYEKIPLNNPKMQVPDTWAVVTLEVDAGIVVDDITVIAVDNPEFGFLDTQSQVVPAPRSVKVEVNIA